MLLVQLTSDSDVSQPSGERLPGGALGLSLQVL